MTFTWECKRLHLRGTKPMCHVLAKRDDTSMICARCPHCPKNIRTRKKLPSKSVNFNLDLAFDFLCSREVTLASSL